MHRCQKCRWSLELLAAPWADQDFLDRKNEQKKGKNSFTVHGFFGSWEFNLKGILTCAYRQIKNTGLFFRSLMNINHSFICFQMCWKRKTSWRKGLCVKSSFDTGTLPTETAELRISFSSEKELPHENWQVLRCQKCLKSHQSQLRFWLVARQSCYRIWQVFPKVAMLEYQKALHISKKK